MPTLPSALIAVSSRHRSMKSPRPWRWRPCRAAQIADVACAAVRVSMIDSGWRIGPPSTSPVNAIIPDSAWRIGSKPGRDELGPCDP